MGPQMTEMEGLERLRKSRFSALVSPVLARRGGGSRRRDCRLSDSIRITGCEDTVVTGKQNRWGYMVIWEFAVKPGLEARFEHVYGPSGDWVRLFQQDSNHLRTELIRVQGSSPRYLTLDFWKSETAYDRFRQKHLGEYEAIDRNCEVMTEGERKLATFVRRV
jgi:hypothetical protein